MNERGVTLVELLVALALGVVVLLGVGTLYRTVAWSSKGDDAQANLQMQAAIVVGELTRQVEAASLTTRTNGVDSEPLTCPNDVTETLYVAQPDGSIYCFYKAGDQLTEYRAPAGGGSPGAWDMLSGSLAPLIVTSVDFSGTTSEMANVSFQLQAVDLRGGAGAAPTMTFTVAIAKRN
jgi:prepilin-type N-terminal cleavage/methylation domain-containing protein